MGAFGFSYVGLFYLIMLFIPNIIWTKFQPDGYAEFAAKENKALQMTERTGEALVTGSVLIFSDFNLRPWTLWSLWLVASFLLMILYEVYWVRYFRSAHTMHDMYKPLFKIPVPGASLPVGAFLLLGIYGTNHILVFSVLILAVGHLSIHLIHAKESK